MRCAHIVVRGNPMMYTSGLREFPVEAVFADDCRLRAELVKAKKTMVEGKFGPVVTSAKRQEAWQKITEDINASSSTKRTKEEVEKKWKNKKSFCTFSSQTTATGGGPPPTPLSPVTDAVVEVVERDNVTLTGIPDGCDSTLFQLHCMDDTSDNFRPTLTRTLSYTATVSTPLIASATETSHSLQLELLLKEKIELEIECLKLKRKYYKMKISNIEE